MIEFEQSLEMEPAKLDASRRFVRITGKRAGGFIEFDFAIGEPEIFAELILAPEAFAEFCRANRVQFLEPADTCGHEDTSHDWNWRLGDVTQTRIR